MQATRLKQEKIFVLTPAKSKAIARSREFVSPNRAFILAMTGMDSAIPTRLEWNMAMWVAYCILYITKAGDVSYANSWEFLVKCKILA